MLAAPKRTFQLTDCCFGEYVLWIWLLPLQAIACHNVRLKMTWPLHINRLHGVMCACMLVWYHQAHLLICTTCGMRHSDIGLPA